MEAKVKNGASGTGYTAQKSSDPTGETLLGAGPCRSPLGKQDTALLMGLNGSTMRRKICWRTLLKKRPRTTRCCTLLEDLLDLLIIRIIRIIRLISIISIISFIRIIRFIS